MSRVLFMVGAAVLSLALAGSAGAQSPYAIIHHFPDPAVANDGQIPGDSLVEDGGVFYGLTALGGLSNQGTAFVMNKDGSSLSVVHHFPSIPNDGTRPDGHLILENGRLYGVTPQGGQFGFGTLFAMNPDGSGYVILHQFGDPAVTNDGRAPSLGVIMAEGRLFGLTASGGTAGNFGALYSVATDGSGYTILHRFRDVAFPQDGVAPRGALLYENGSLYGMTVGGGQFGFGTLFSLSTAGGGYTVLHNFAWSFYLPRTGHNPGGVWRRQGASSMG